MQDDPTNPNPDDEGETEPPEPEFFDRTSPGDESRPCIVVRHVEFVADAIDYMLTVYPAVVEIITLAGADRIIVRGKLDVRDDYVPGLGLLRYPDSML